MSILTPNWKVPANIHSAFTTRTGGVSTGAYESFNLGDHVGDIPEHVIKNRAILKEKGKLPSEPVWLKQVHGADILNLDSMPSPRAASPHTIFPGETMDLTSPFAKGVLAQQGGDFPDLPFDATFTTQPNRVCAIMTADCLPLLLCDESGLAIAAVHCGWRSIAAGIIENTITLMQSQTTAPIIAWLGPAIGPEAFEVGEEVREQFSDKSAFTLLPSHLTPHLGAQPFKHHLLSHSHPKYLANIYQLARTELLKHGVLAKHIYETPLCTYSDPKQFYSFRRDGATGRMASLIWKV